MRDRVNEAALNKITEANAGGPCQFPIRTPLATRVGQFGLGPERRYG